MEILIAEDEKQIAGTLKKRFLEIGFHPMAVPNGEAALAAVEKIVFDVIILDWRMPKLSGLEVCKILREREIKAPIILLTALSDISNKVEALNAGADDYITKPFSFDELLARVNAVVRRFHSTTTELGFNNCTLNLVDHTLVKPNEIIKLSQKEYDLLKFFLKNKNSIVSKDQICQQAWGTKCSPLSNIVEVTIKNLRRKLESKTHKSYIRTIYGEGYIFFADEVLKH
ncbi:MAG: two-component response regulator transcriptional regulatory protein [Ignavibacteria bacterium]|nr:MAG: two-component response regulator transcriptional regulatory protein [Ignavibacteria bacterium]KAF0157612.1 MAG: two-component response regulator transcriptional regulatory protein [Ignavibacteria bacterium]